MRILYLSCHSILEYDEVSMFNDLGHYVFSPGAYVEPRNPGDNSLRPGLLNIKYDQDDIDAWHSLGKPGRDNKECLTREFIKRFDAVIVMHIPKWIGMNWNALKEVPTVWRTIGQSISPQERYLAPFRKEGLKVVRYSPMEQTIPGYIGADALIRFYKDPEEFKGWTGDDERVITFAQHMQARNQACNFTLFEEATRPFPRGLYGPGNENSGDFAHGKQEFSELKRLMREARCYFYTGTHPASYTLNFMEAWMTGIPIVAIGPKNGNASYFPDHNLYEIPEFIENGVNGFISDDINELQANIKMLLNDKKLAKEISEKGRESAVKYFGKATIKEQWKAFLKEIQQ